MKKLIGLVLVLVLMVSTVFAMEMPMFVVR